MIILYKQLLLINRDRLSYHYAKISGKRSEALKYTAKSADLAIRHAAFGEGLVYVQTAQKMSRNYVEFKALLKIVDLALNEINAVKARDFRLSSSFVFSKATRNSPEYEAYKQLKEELQKQITDLKKGSAVKSAAQSTAPSGKSSISINNGTSSNNNIPSIIEEAAPSPANVAVQSSRRAPSERHDYPFQSNRNDAPDESQSLNKTPKARPSFGTSMVFQLSYTDRKVREMQNERKNLALCNIS